MFGSQELWLSVDAVSLVEIHRYFIDIQNNCMYCGTNNIALSVLMFSYEIINAATTIANENAHKNILNRNAYLMISSQTNFVVVG